MAVKLDSLVQLEQAINIAVPDIHKYRQQFAQGTASHIETDSDKRYFQMDPIAKNETLKHVFQVFDAIETTDGLKAQIQEVVAARVKVMQMKMMA